MDQGTILALILVDLVLLAAAAYGGYRVGVSRLPLPAVLYEELADLRHIKAQLEHPEQPVPEHEHIYPREPDVRKLGWLRYKCVVPKCPALKWVEK